MEEIMSKLSREELQRIISEDLPGYRVAEKNEGAADSSTAASSAKVDIEGETPDLGALRVKYLREKYLGLGADSADVETDALEETAESAEANPDEDEIVAVTPENAAHPWDRGARPKATVVSGKEKKVIGQQG
jgi:hypothetical protein